MLFVFLLNCLNNHSIYFLIYHVVYNFIPYNFVWFEFPELLLDWPYLKLKPDNFDFKLLWLSKFSKEYFHNLCCFLVLKRVNNSSINVSCALDCPLHSFIMRWPNFEHIPNKLSVDVLSRYSLFNSIYYHFSLNFHVIIQIHKSFPKNSTCYPEFKHLLFSLFDIFNFLPFIFKFSVNFPSHKFKFVLFSLFKFEHFSLMCNFCKVQVFCLANNFSFLNLIFPEMRGN